MTPDPQLTSGAAAVTTEPVPSRPRALGLEGVVIETPADSSAARAVRGGTFTVVGHAATQALRMGGQIVLTRIVPQEAFGLMALVHTFRACIDLFSDVGIGPSIIQNERGDEPRFLDTAWTVQFVRGVALFCVGGLLALPVARFYGHAELALVIPVSCAAAIIAGSRSTKAYIAERHLALGLLTIIEIIAAAAALTVTVTWALFSPTVWALAAGALTGATVDVVLGHTMLSGYNAKFGWDKSASASMVRFGRWIFLSTALTFAVNEADRLVFGKMISLADLGVYNVALTIAGIPTTAMISLAGRVIFPLFSRVNQAGTHLAVIFRQARRLHLVISGWALSGLIGGGQAAIGLIYDQRYADGGWMLQLLALGAWFATPEATNSSALLACGQPRWVAAGNLGKLIGMFVFLPLGFRLGGFPGALLGYAASELPRYAVSTFGVYRRGLRTVTQDILFTAVVLASSAISYWTVIQLRERGFHSVLQSFVVFIVASIVWSPWLWPYARQMLHKVQARLARA
jgi:O-antigen/teichoic acid export membrane protein